MTSDFIYHLFKSQQDKIDLISFWMLLLLITIMALCFKYKRNLSSHLFSFLIIVHFFIIGPVILFRNYYFYFRDFTLMYGLNLQQRKTIIFGDYYTFLNECDRILPLKANIRLDLAQDDCFNRMLARYVLAPRRLSSWHTNREWDYAIKMQDGKFILERINK